MQIRHLKVMHLVTILTLGLLPQALSAQEAVANLAESWLITVKPGHQAAFETAFRAHQALREEQEDPREWDVYSPEVGDTLNTYAIRHCCFAWPDQDEYTRWSMGQPSLMEQWSADIDQHVESVSHYYLELDIPNSHLPSDSASSRMLGVTEFEIAPGKAAQFHAVRAEISQVAINQGWAAAGNHWTWFDRVGGTPVAGIATPYKNFADMTPDGPSFLSFLTEHMGEAKASELMEKFSSSVASTSYMIWVHRSDLSSSRD